MPEQQIMIDINDLDYGALETHLKAVKVKKKKEDFEKIACTICGAVGKRKYLHTVYHYYTKRHTKALAHCNPIHRMWITR